MEVNRFPQNICPAGVDKVKNLNKYLTPEIREVMKLIEALKDDEHWALFIRLLLKNDIPTLTDLREEFDSTYHEIKPILDDLIKGDLIEEFFISPHNEGNLDKRYYRVSIQGIRFYYLLMDAILPGREEGQY